VSDDTNSGSSTLCVEVVTPRRARQNLAIRVAPHNPGQRRRPPPATCRSYVTSPHGYFATSPQSAPRSNCPGATDRPRARSTGSRCSCAKCMAGPALGCSGSVSCQPPEASRRPGEAHGRALVAEAKMQGPDGPVGDATAMVLDRRRHRWGRRRRGTGAWDAGTARMAKLGRADNGAQPPPHKVRKNHFRVATDTGGLLGRVTPESRMRPTAPGGRSPVKEFPVDLHGLLTERREWRKPRKLGNIDPGGVHAE